MPRKYNKLAHEPTDPERVKACSEWFGSLTEKHIKPWLINNGYLPNYEK